ncbi:MAG: amidohydrolase family protein [Desulfobacterales bacterium]|nr:amidohydrolase family protein [Desulfobacterales bacterium]
MSSTESQIEPQPGPDGMNRICVEEHWTNSDLEDILQAHRQKTGLPLFQKAGPGPAALADLKAREQDFEQHRLARMDAAGVAVQVLATGFPGIQGVQKANDAVSAARKANDFQAEIINRFPDRYAGFAALPLQNPRAAADELERTVTQLGFKGSMIHGHTNGEYLDERKFQVVWERTEVLGVPLYLHIAESLWSSRIYANHPGLKRWSWGAETANHALKIIFSGVFDDFPGATLMLGHLGEALPFLLGRIDQKTSVPPTARKLKKEPSEYIKENIIVTTSGKYRPEALLCTISALGADRVLLAADYPHGDMQDAVKLVENTPLSDADKEKIYFRNAMHWLKTGKDHTA